MKILKGILIGVIGLIVLFLLIALVIDKDYEVVREVEINKPKGEVFSYIKFIKNQDNYAVWNQRDPNMKKEYRNEDGTVGFVSAWESEDKEVGTGEQEIKAIVEGERMDMELRFKVPFEATEQAYMVTEAVSEGTTKVKWGFNGHMPYPMNTMLLFMDFDKMIGGDLEQGLKNLKNVLETMPAPQTPSTETMPADSGTAPATPVNG